MFYKIIDGELTYGPFVTFPDGVMLHTNDLETLVLPHEGWYYFATEQEAKDFFGIVE